MPVVRPVSAMPLPLIKLPIMSPVVVIMVLPLITPSLLTVSPTPLELPKINLGAPASAVPPVKELAVKAIEV